MPNFFDLFGFLSNLFNNMFNPDGSSPLLPGSSFHALVAAFSTQGYWVHSDMLYMIGATKFQHFAVLIYMFALVGGIAGAGLGAPPKMYLWFIMGPALFHFLLGTTQPVMGVMWRVAGVPQEQAEVWKLAEVGLANTQIANRNGITVHAYASPDGGSDPDYPGDPAGTVRVSYFFAQLDGLVSDTVQNMISWLGIYDLRGSESGDTNSNRIPLPSGDAKTDIKEQNKWYLLSNLKWGYLDTITSARLSSTELRDAFATFMAGTCGDKFQEQIDPGRYVAADKSTNGRIPVGIFKHATDKTDLQYAQDPLVAYASLDTALTSTSMSAPLALDRMLRGYPEDKDAPKGSFREVFNGYFFSLVAGDSNKDVTAENIEKLLSHTTIRCSHYLDILVKGFRWEAAQVYGQLEGELPKGLTNPQILNYALLYGWDIRRLPVDKLFDSSSTDPFSKMIADGEGTPISADAGEGHVDEQQQYILNLIFINMLKNEFMIVPNAATGFIKNSSSTSAINAIEQYQKTVGSKNKFGEVYTWAMMMPYLQGTLLYLLAIGYPFACMFVLIPGWHKIIFTWSSFWIWAKIWDLGFAIVTILERSIWSTIGNSSRASGLNPYVVQMIDWGTTTLTREANSTIPSIAIVDKPEFLVATATSSGNFASYAYLDRAMTLFSNMDLDLQNSYYIYIMAALYFAVPAVTGQLVLGAKASAAGLLTSAFTQMSQETGSKAGAAFTAGLQKNVEANSQSADQAFLAKNLAKQGLLAGAIDTQNRAQLGTLGSQYLGQYGDGLSAKSGMLDMIGKRRGADSEQGHFMLKNALANPGEMLKAAAIMGTALGRPVSNIIQAGNQNQTRGVGAPGVSGGGGGGAGGSGGGGLPGGSPTGNAIAPHLDPTGNGGVPGSGGTGIPGTGRPGTGGTPGGGTPRGGVPTGGATGGGASGGGGSGGGASGGGTSGAPGTGYVATGTGGGTGGGTAGGGGGASGMPRTGTVAGGGGAGGGAGGPTTGSGGPTTGDIRSFLEGGKEMMMNNFYGPLGFGVDTAGKMQGYAIQRSVLDQQAQLSADRTQMGIQGFEQRADADRLNAEGQRLMAYAQGAAQSGAWYEKAAFATQATPLLAAMGVQGPSIGQKPTDAMYLARSGIAGEEAQEASNFFRGYDANVKGSGVFQGAAQGYSSNLYNNFGSDKLMQGMYQAQTSSPMNELQQGVQRFSDMSQAGIQQVTTSFTADDMKTLADKDATPEAKQRAMDHLGQAAAGFMHNAQGSIGPAVPDPSRPGAVRIDNNSQPPTRTVPLQGGAVTSAPTLGRPSYPQRPAPKPPGP